jgi:hypothetical protein
MFGLGMQEFLILGALVIILALPIVLSLYLRKVAPGRMSVGLPLSLIFVPFGQLYLQGAAIYIGLLIIALLIFYFAIPSALGYFLATGIASAGIMYYRLKEAGQSNTYQAPGRQEVKSTAYEKD